MMIDSEKFIEYCKEEKEKTEARLRSFLRSDGVPKKGCSIGVMGCGDHIRGYELSIANIEKYIKNQEAAAKMQSDDAIIELEKEIMEAIRECIEKHEEGFYDRVVYTETDEIEVRSSYGYSIGEDEWNGNAGCLYSPRWVTSLFNEDFISDLMRNVEHCLDGKETELSDQEIAYIDEYVKTHPMDLNEGNCMEKDDYISALTDALCENCDKTKETAEDIYSEAVDNEADGALEEIWKNNTHLISRKYIHAKYTSKNKPLYEKNLQYDLGYFKNRGEKSEFLSVYEEEFREMMNQKYTHSED